MSLAQLSVAFAMEEIFVHKKRMTIFTDLSVGTKLQENLMKF
jgi:hypothetical protein